MRSLIKCAGILVCLFLSAACAKEQINSVEEPSHAQEWDASKYLLGFDASMEDMTKAEIDFSSGSVTWTNGDKVLVGEVSMCNDDNCDNRFYEPLGRFPTIEEDEPPYRLLCTEYPRVK